MSTNANVSGFDASEFIASLKIDKIDYSARPLSWKQTRNTYRQTLATSNDDSKIADWATKCQKHPDFVQSEFEAATAQGITLRAENAAKIEANS